MPAYVTGFHYDVFISYAQVAEPGWVVGFEKELRGKLDNVLGGTGQVSIFWDRSELSGDSSLNPAIAQAVQSSGVLLMLMSRAYLGRRWCRKERETFLKRTNGGRGRALLAHLEEVPQTDWPPEITALDCLGFKFWESHPERKHVVRPLPLNSDSFDWTIRDLAESLGKRLKELKNLKDSQTSTEMAAPSAPVVFLADGLMDRELKTQRVALDTFLREHPELPNLTVVPQQSFYDEPEDCTAMVDSLLRQSTVFVQLLGKQSYAPDELFPPGYEIWLRDRALAAGKRPGYDLLRWRLQTVTSQSIGDRRHCDFVFANDVIGGPPDEFQQFLVEMIQRIELDKKFAAQRVDGAVAKNGFVLVDADTEDERLEQALIETFRTRKVRYASADNDKDYFVKLASSNRFDGLVMVYGDCESRWVSDRFRLCVELWLRKSRRPRFGIYFAQSTNDRPLKTYPDNLYEIREGDQNALERFLADVKEVAR